MNSRMLLVVSFIIGCFSTPMRSDVTAEPIRVELTESNRLDMGDIDDANYVSFRDIYEYDRYYEEINHIPSQYDVTDTFFICVQPQQEAFRLESPDESDPHFYAVDSTPLYTDSAVDCIISICTVSDSTQDYVIIDTNNDEDLTNDPLLPLTLAVQKLSGGMYTGGEYEYYYANTSASAEYYTGSEVMPIDVPLHFRIIVSSDIFGNEKLRYFYRLNLMQTGVLTIDGQDYTIGIPHAGEVEVSHTEEGWRPNNTVWIDVNRNGRFEQEDFYETIHSPFTVSGSAFRLIESERFGNSLVLEKLGDTDHPPVAIGLSAPLFRAQTLDNQTFDLAEAHGQYVLLDFWGSWCGPCVGELFTLKEAYEKYGDTVRFVSIGVDDDRNALEACIAEHNLEWPQIYTPFGTAIPERYQVHGYPTVFLVGPDGTIVARDDELRAQNLIPTLEKFLK